jgi:inosine-uridine nucleoside N-ribohydrolase
MKHRHVFLCAAIPALALQTHLGRTVAASETDPSHHRPVRLIFDTDMGNDIDDALALGVIHALQSRGECELLAVTVTKDNEFCAPFVDLVNNFYGRGSIPIGVVRDGKTPEDSAFLRVPAQAKDNGRQRYPYKIRSSKDAPEAVGLLRQILAKQPDQSVVMVVVGFSTNIARLLDSKPDGHSSLDGKELVARKCRLLSIMAGMYGPNNTHKEYNVVMDLPSARKIYAEWPTPIVASGFEIGIAIMYPVISIQRDFSYVRHHPVREAYELYMEMPYDRPTWDLTSVLYAVRPDREYFGLSEPGTIQLDDEGRSNLIPSPEGRHRYLTVDEHQITRVREALVQLASQPPDSIKAR